MRRLYQLNVVEKDRHGMRGVGQTAVGKGIRTQQVAELFLDLRLGHGDPGQQGKAQQQGKCCYQ